MMGEVGRELTFPYAGGEYTFVPSILVLKRIKARGINTSTLAHQCLHGGVELIDLAEALRVMLGAAGKDVSVDEAYYWLTSGDAEIMKFQMAYIQMAMPGIDLGKKPEAPAQSPAKPRAKKSRAT